MIRDAASDGSEEAKSYLKRLTPGPNVIDIEDPSELMLEDTNTPDIIGGMKGADNDKGLFTFLRRR